MKKLILAAAVAAISLPALAMQVSGVKLDDSINVSGQALVLNGAGLRTKFGLADVYVAGLYVPSKTHDAVAIIGTQEARRVTLVMKRHLDADTLMKAFHEGLEANVSKDELQTLQPKIKLLDDQFQQVGAVKEGDILNLDFGANGDTRITLNGKQKEAIPGSDLSSALLKIWLGKAPVQDGLKQAMLNG